MKMGELQFCRNFVFLKGRPMSFAGRPYLHAPYDSQARRLVLRCSRQTEKTTLIIARVLYTAIAHPGVHIVCVFPRQEQASVFSRSRLLPTIYDSPVLRRLLLGRRGRRPPVGHLQMVNSSEVYIRSAFHSGDPVRGIDGDVLWSTSSRTLPWDTCPFWRSASVTQL